MKNEKTENNTQFLLGNEAIARAALEAGVHFVSGYPGTHFPNIPAFPPGRRRYPTGRRPIGAKPLTYVSEFLQFIGITVLFAAILLVSRME